MSDEVAFEPLYPRSPYYYPTFTALLLLFEVETSVVEAILPDPLSPPERPTCSIWFTDYGRVSGFGPYREFLLGVNAEHDGQVLTYSPYYGLDAVVPLAAGREVWGIPKYYGDVTFEERENRVRASFTRGGVELAAATMQQNRVVDTPLARTETVMAFRKTIPAATSDAPPAVDRIVTMVLRDIETERAITGPVDLVLERAAGEPMDAFEPVGDITGYLVETRWVLDRTDDAVIHQFEEHEP